MPLAAVIPLHQKVSKIVKTGVAAQDLLLEQQRTALIDVVKALELHPKLRGPTKAWLDELILQEETEMDVKCHGLFATAPMNIGHIEEEFVLSFLTSRSGLTMRELGAIKAFNGGAIAELLQFELNCTGQCKLPADCRCRDTLFRALTARATNSGSMLEGICFDSEYFLASGQIHWVRLGEFSLTVNDKKIVTHIKHKRSGVSVPVSTQDFRITDAFELWHNYSQTKAVLKSGARKYSCLEFFGKNADVKATKPLSGDAQVLKDLVEVAKTQVQTALEEAQKNQAPKLQMAEYKAPLETKRKDVAKRAREALEKAAEERKKARTLTVASAKVVEIKAE
eukprot:6472520-Amphidinium_carterae.1